MTATCPVMTSQVNGRDKIMEPHTSNLTTLPAGATASYDHAGELTSSTSSGTTTSYTYNADGQRLTAKQGGTTIASGTWNGAGRLTTYSNAVANMTAASYDGVGLLASVSGATFVWNITSAVPQLLMDSSNAYIYGSATSPAEQVNLSTGSLTYLSLDSLGSVRGVVSSSGALLASTAYDAWGNPESTGGLTGYTPFGYAGAHTDPTGLLYLLNRYYDPQTGEFLSVDPYLTQTLVPYGYAGGDPVDVTDPTGAEPDPNKCMAFIMDPHISSTQTGRPVKVNGRIQECLRKPIYGEIWIELWKTGFIFDHRVISTDVNSNQKGHRFFWDGTTLKWVMRDYSTLHKCDDHVTDTTLYALMKAKVHEHNGKTYYTPNFPGYGLRSHNRTLKCHTS